MSISPAMIYQRLGGDETIKEEIRSEIDLIRAVRKGFPMAAVRYLLRQKFVTSGELETLVAPRRTLAHRTKKRQPLTAEQSDRLLRLARVMAFASDTFQNEEKAHHWLRTPSRALGRVVPLSLLDTDGGARLVEDELDRIAHGLLA
jgi:putative toxin-antitoxin system antitoxin component (TIGR02293 family)